MRVAIVTHAVDQPTRGNHTTVQRWIHHTEGAYAVAADPEQTLDPVPDLIHGYHALHGGVAARALARRYRRPLVISLGGTDLHRLRAGEGALVREILGDAAVVTGAFDSFAELVPGARYVTVPRGIDVAGPPAPRAPDGTLRALLVSGLRPVKDPLLAIDLAAELRSRGLPLALRILGAPLDDAYAAEVRARGDGRVQFGEVPPEAMAAAYRDADVVWNTSLHEGGANALLEAVAHGCAVFARDVPGNRDFFVGDDPPGRLFVPGDADAAESFHRALLAETAAGRARRAGSGVAWLKEHYPTARETEALLSAWRAARSA